MSAQERAASLVNSGLAPSMPIAQVKKGKGDKSGKIVDKIPSLVDSDDEDDDEDDTSFGIIPKAKILKDSREAMNQF